MTKMVCLFCQCLNVAVHCKDASWKTRAVLASQLFPDGSKERLVTGGETVYEVDLDVAGVFVEHKALVVSHTVGDWVIHRCSNCDVDVYISHAVKDGKIFVSGKLLSDVQSVKSHENYSKMFKIVIRDVPEEDGDSFRRKRVSSMTFGREDPVMKLVHAQMKSYLNKEQEAMEERIRMFEEVEREAFLKLQKKAHSHRTSLFSAIGRARENVISDAIRESMTVTTHTYTEPAHVMTFTNSGTTKQPVVRKAHSPTEPPQQKVTITLQDRAPKSRTKSPDIDDPSMFSLDGFDEGDMLDDADGVAIATGGGVAFPQSDDEEISTDDSSYRDMSALSAGGVAMSVPVGIPMFAPLKDTTDGVSRNLPVPEERHFDPNHVGNSIKALALSVQDTSMFGELPRPRIMTNPYARKW